MTTTVHKSTTEAAQQITRDNLHWGSTLGAAAGPISFGFRISAAGYAVNGHDISQFSTLTASEQDAARAALGYWAAAANITFTDLGNSNNATIEFANYRDPNDNSEAFASFPGSTAVGNPAGDVFVNTAFASTTNDGPGTYEYLTFIHEIGHALGLEHPGSYNAAPGVKITYDNNAEYIEDTHQYTVMSYFGESFTGANYFGTNPETPMLDDIAAIQRLYGANTTTRTGNTTYGFNSNAGTPYTITSISQPVVFTIWDAGGNDTLDFSGYSQNQSINLNAESFSSVGGLTGNISIARGVAIESATGGPGNDTITGNAADNVLKGGRGNDTIDGELGTDSAVFSGLRSAYTLTALTGNGVRVSSPDGTDTLSNVERLVFDDQTVNWPVSSTTDDFADSLTDATAPFGQLALGVSGAGVLEVIGDRDWFRVSLAANTTYVVDLQGLSSSSGTLEDPYVRVHNSAGTTLAEDDDITTGVNRDSRLTFTTTAAGTYYVEAGAFNDNYAGTYKVGIAFGGPTDDYANSLFDSSHPFGTVVVNGSNTGNLEVAGDRDWFQVQLIAGTTYLVNVLGLHAGAGTLEDSYLRVHGSSGATLAENDDISLGINRDSQLSFTAPTTGTYYLEAGAFDDDYTGTYRISVSGTASADDYANSLTDFSHPRGSVQVSGSTTGSLETRGDRDWFQVQLIAGTSYLINLQGQPAGGGTLEDPYLRVHNSSGALLAENDDIVLGINRDSQLTFTPSTTGTYYLEAGAFDDNYTGTYKVSVTGTAPQLPDLTSNISVSNTAPNPGQNETISYQINNIGTVAAGGFFAGFYLSTDQTISTADTLLDFQFFGSLSGNSFTSSSTTVTLPGSLTPGTTYYLGVIADDLDGVAESNESNNASFVPITIPTVPAKPHWLASVDVGPHPAGWLPMGIADFNNDGSSDLAWFNASNRDVDIWKLQNGQWSGSVDIGTHPAGYTPSGTGDFNHDGTSDVLWYNPTTSDTDIWLLSNGHWAASTTIGTHPAGYQIAGIGDFNHDGTSDVVWFNSSNNDVDIWLVQNGHWAGSVDVGPHPAGYQIAGTGDFNHDGTSDVLWYNPTTHDTDIWLLSNGHWAGSTTIGTHPAGYQIAGIGDFNQDGTSDVVWYNPTNNDIDVWLVQNGHWAGSVGLGSHPAGAVTVGVGDFDHNGVSDIMWRDTGSGHIDNWLLAYS